MKQMLSGKMRKTPQNFEVFFVRIVEQIEGTAFWNSEKGQARGAGFYYWFRSPGSLPHSGATGPFDSQLEALTHAQDNAYADEMGDNWQGRD